MKRVFIFALIVCAAWFAQAEGKAEANKPTDITFLHAPGTKMEIPISRGYKGPAVGEETWSALTKLYADKHPNVRIKELNVDLTTGATLSMDAMLAAGNPPDVYYDAALRASKYIDTAYALDLKPYLPNLADYNAVEIAKVTRGNGVYALPASIWATGMCVNLDIMSEIGFQVPENWTIAQFDDMAAKAKAKGYYATYLFAQNQSSNQWWMGWFYAFGAQEFAGGDYSRTRINSPQAVKALNYMKSLIDRGYVRKDAAAVSDGEVLSDFTSGKVAAGVMQSGHTAGIAAAVKAGTLKKAFDFKFVPMPHSDAVAGTPAAAGASLYIAKATKDAARNKAVGNFVSFMGGKENQDLAAYSGYSYPTLKGVDTSAFTKHDAAILDIVNRFGTMDLGIASPKFPAVRASMFPLLQQFYQGNMTAEKLLAEYESTVNAIMAGK